MHIHFCMFIYVCVRARAAAAEQLPFHICVCVRILEFEIDFLICWNCLCILSTILNIFK